MLSRVRPIDYWEFPEFSREFIPVPSLGSFPGRLICFLVDRERFEGEREKIRVEELPRKVVRAVGMSRYTVVAEQGFTSPR